MREGRPLRWVTGYFRTQCTHGPPALGLSPRTSTSPPLGPALLLCPEGAGVCLPGIYKICPLNFCCWDLSELQIGSGGLPTPAPCPCHTFFTSSSLSLERSHTPHWTFKVLQNLGFILRSAPRQQSLWVSRRSLLSSCLCTCCSCSSNALPSCSQTLLRLTPWPPLTP